MTGRSLAPTTLIFKMHGISGGGGEESGRVELKGVKGKGGWLQKRAWENDLSSGHSSRAVNFTLNIPFNDFGGVFSFVLDSCSTH